jgi:hypothetical protein
VSAVDPRLRWVRMAALAGGAGLLAVVMLFLSESRWRDLAWSVAVALLILALVANRLIARQGRRDADPKP